MQIPLGMFFDNVVVFTLVFVRMTGLFVIAPIFGRRNIPVYLKIGLSLMMAVIIVNTVKVSDLKFAENLYAYVMVVAREFIVGLILGYVSYLVFSAIYLAGQLIDMQIGFGMVNVLDPISNIQVPITSNFYFIIAMLLFLSTEGHHLMIKALFESYKLVPLGEAAFNNNLMDDFFRVFINMFATGIKIATPVIAAILITDIVLGLLSKTIPQINVFVVGMPIKIMLGLVVVIITIPAFISLVGYLKDLTGREMLDFMRDMGNKK